MRIEWVDDQAEPVQISMKPDEAKTLLAIADRGNAFAINSQETVLLNVLWQRLDYVLHKELADGVSRKA